MANRWPKVRLGEVADLITGFPFSSERYVEDSNEPRLLRGDNIVQGTLRWDGAKRWPRDATDDVSAYWLREGDVVIAMDRPWIEAGLKFARIRQQDLPALLVQRVARLRGNGRLDNDFLKFVMGSRSFTEYVLSVQTGTGVPHISGGQIRGFEFSLPPLDDQRAIARILGVLDDKIELNRRMPGALSSFALTVFRSWFVNFDPVHAKTQSAVSNVPRSLLSLFPGSFANTALGEIPKGWQTQCIGEFVTHSKSRIGDDLAPEYSATVVGLTLRDTQFRKNSRKHLRQTRELKKTISSLD